MMTINRINHDLETSTIMTNTIKKAYFDLYYHPNMILEDEFKEKYLCTHLYFVTIQLSPAFISEEYTKTHQSISFVSLDAFYRWMNSKFIVKATGRNSKLQPLLQLYLDDQNSRYNEQNRPITVPHFHGLLLLHPKTAARFERFLKQFLNNDHQHIEIREPSFAPIESVTFSRFAPELGSLQKLSSYVTKFARNDRFSKGKENGIVLERVYPRCEPKYYPWYKDVECHVYYEWNIDGPKELSNRVDYQKLQFERLAKRNSKYSPHFLSTPSDIAGRQQNAH